MTTSSAPHPGIGFRQFVALIAAFMAVNAFAVDIMLPALPQIGESLGVVDHNQNQLIITAYLLGFGFAQLIYGALADRYGRKPVLLAGLSIYVVCAVLCAFAKSFEMMLLARLLCGIGAAATRVLTVSIVRDSYSGRQMARVMSSPSSSSWRCRSWLRRLVRRSCSCRPGHGCSAPWPPTGRPSASGA